MNWFQPMKTSRVIAAFLLVAAIGYPCSVSLPRKLWSKKPGAKSTLFAFERNGRVGFINASGKVVIAPTIDASIEDVGDFSDGLARIRSQGFIDETGKWIIKGKYVWSEDFSEGLALVEVEGPPKDAMYLDRTGQVISRVPEFRTGSFSGGLAAYEAKGKPGVRKFRPLEYRDYPGLKGFVNRIGELSIQPAYAEVGPFSDDLARVVLDGYCHVETAEGDREGTPTTRYPTSCGGAPADAVTPCGVGFIDPAGKFAIEPNLESARDSRMGWRRPDSSLVGLH